MMFKRYIAPQRLLLLPMFTLYLLALVIPIVYFFSIGFMTYSPVEMYEHPVTVNNFLRLLNDSYYLGIFIKTLKIALLTAVFAILLGYPLAFFLARTQTSWRALLMFLVIAPLMSGVIVRTYAWIMLLSSNGVLADLLVATGLVSSRPQFLYTEFAVVVALVHIMLPYAVFAIYSAVAVQDHALEKAAFTLGASRVRAFLEITLPLSKTGIVMGSVLVFTLSAGAIVTPALLGGTEVVTLGMTIYDLVSSTLNWPFASAFAAVLVLIQFLLIAGFMRTNRQHQEAA